MKAKLLLVLAFSLLFSACATPSTPQSSEPELPADNILSTPEVTLPSETIEPAPAIETVPAMQMTTYTDEFAGFSLDYPTGWFIDASAAANADQAFAYAVSIATWDLRYPPTPSGKGQNGMPEGATKIDVSVTKQQMTLEEAVTQQTQNESGSPILAREDVTLANGLPAVILDVEGFAGLTRTLITTLNGNVIYVAGYGELEPFESIALSLRAK